MIANGPQRVFIGIPAYDNRMDCDTMFSLFGASHPRSRVEIVRKSVWSSSLLHRSFTELWAECARVQDMERQHGHDVEWFCMLHSDVAPKGYWLDYMVEEAIRVNAEILSMCIRIKHFAYDYSTAMHVNGKYKRLNERDLRGLPRTFTRHEVARLWGLREYGALCLNTGCWVARFTSDWVRQLQRPFILDGGIHWDKPNYPCWMESEDWMLSRQLHDMGVEGLYATQWDNCHKGIAGYATWDNRRGDSRRRAKEANSRFVGLRKPSKNGKLRRHVGALQ